MPDPQTNKPAAKTPPKAPALIAAAVLIAAPLAVQFEGYRGKAYYDPAHILTQCYGETSNIDPSVIYSKDQCAAKLRTRMAKDYAPQILKCLPQLDMDHRYVFGALLDASYNAGPAAACKSRMAIAVKAGNWSAACAGFIGWYTTALNQQTGVRTQLPGLVRRRKAERVTCLTVASVAVVQPVVPPAPPAAAQVAPTPPPPAPSLMQRIAAFFHSLGL